MRDGFSIQDKVTIKKIKKDDNKKINNFSISNDITQNEIVKNEDGDIDENNRKIFFHKEK